MKRFRKSLLGRISAVALSLLIAIIVAVALATPASAQTTGLGGGIFGGSIWQCNALTGCSIKGGLLTVASNGVAFPGATSGTATVVAPAVAGTTTITLPSATSTLVGTQGTVSLSAQAASIVTTNLVAAPAVGLWRVCGVADVTTAATTSSSILITFGWTAAAATTDATAAYTGNALGGHSSGCFAVRVASGALTYSTTYSSVGATAMQYSLSLSAERLQ